MPKPNLMRVYNSQRGYPLIWHGDPPPYGPILTMEISGKWYEAYIIHCDGSITKADFDGGNDEWLYDNVPTPKACHRIARRLNIEWDELALEMIAGRWVQEHDGDEDWSIDLKSPEPEFDDSRGERLKVNK